MKISEWIIEELPKSIPTATIVGIVFGIYRLTEYLKNRKKEAYKETEEFKEKTIKKAKVYEDINLRFTNLENHIIRLEKDLEQIKEDIREDKIMYKENFDRLYIKLDSIYNFLIEKGN